MNRLPMSQMAGACGFLVTLKMTLQTHCRAFLLSAKVPVDHVAQCNAHSNAGCTLAQETHLRFAPDSQSVDSVLQVQC